MNLDHSYKVLPSSSLTHSKLGFNFRNKSCFSFEANRRLVAATSMSVLAMLHIHKYMHASQCLHMLDTVYHRALRFITNLKALTHLCSPGWMDCRLWKPLAYSYLYGHSWTASLLPSDLHLAKKYGKLLSLFPGLISCPRSPY